MDFKGLADKAKGFIDKNGDKVNQGLDKAGEAAKSKFQGHDSQIDGVINKAKNAAGSNATGNDAAGENANGNDANGNNNDR